MTSKTKLLLSSLISALAGILVGGIIMFNVTTTILGDFFSHGVVTDNIVELKFNIQTLKYIRQGNNEKAIDLLELGVRGNLIYLGTIDGELAPETTKSMLVEISKAKEYMNNNPIKYLNSDEEALINNALNKIEN